MGRGLAAPSPNPSPSTSAQLQTSHISPSGGARPGRARSYDLVKKIRPGARPGCERPDDPVCLLIIIQHDLTLTFNDLATTWLHRRSGAATDFAPSYHSVNCPLSKVISFNKKVNKIRVSKNRSLFEV